LFPGAAQQSSATHPGFGSSACRREARALALQDQPPVPDHPVVVQVAPGREHQQVGDVRVSGRMQTKNAAELALARRDVRLEEIHARVSRVRGHSRERFASRLREQEGLCRDVLRRL
jgi:hypothetical protein